MCSTMPRNRGSLEGKAFLAMERGNSRAAFIANEEVGAISMEVHDRKLFFGLKTISELLVVPREGVVEWPSPSLEAHIIPIAERLSYLREYTVSRIVHEWMETNSKNPWDSASIRIREQLVTRGLLEKIEDKDFFIPKFGPVRFSTPPSTLDLVSQAPVSLISKMISDFEMTQPDLWQWIMTDAAEGVTKRQKHYR